MPSGSSSQRAAAWGLLLALGCGVEASRGGFGFDNATAPPSSPAPEDDAPSESSSSSAEGETSSASSSSDDDGAPPVGSSDEGSTSSGGDDPSAGETTGGLPDGMQPASGMYSTCIDAGVCAPLTVCMQILDAMMMPTDGYCTALGCSDPTTQCAAAPGGTATPSCYAITANGMPDAVCALDCSGGKTCPIGMTCRNLTGGQVCS